MSRPATKAADSRFYLARIAASARNERLCSREGASEEIGIDRTRIARIELGSLTPYPEEVLMMADAYGAPELMNHYCSCVCPLGRNTVPKLEGLTLDRLSLKLLGAFRRGDQIKDVLMDITEDGAICQEELGSLVEVMTFLESVTKAAGELRLFISKNWPEMLTSGRTDRTN